MAKQTLREMILVFPDGGRSFYTNYRDGSVRYEDFIVEELPRHVEASYRVSPGRAHRALAGTSMGGYGALKIAMRHPTRYAGAAAHSAIVFPVPNPLDVPEAARSGRSFQYLSGVFRTIYGDPFDQEYFDANNPLDLARKADLDGLAFYFDYGTADRYNRSVGLGAGNQKLDLALSKSGVEHVFLRRSFRPGIFRREQSSRSRPQSGPGRASLLLRLWDCGSLQPREIVTRTTASPTDGHSSTPISPNPSAFSRSIWRRDS